MIENKYLIPWKKEKAPWRHEYQVEQDLLLSRALVSLYNNEIVRDSLVFRGGTALNKLYIEPPARYSEDIDLVQIRPEAIGKTYDAMQESLAWLGTPIRKITQRSAKLYYPYQTVEGTKVKLKIEVNTTEHFQVLQLNNFDFGVDSEWFKGEANIPVYKMEEMLATKLRALYQRRKGRDLFDIWYINEHMDIDWKLVSDIFDKYSHHDGTPITRDEFNKNMLEKKHNPDFRQDMSHLLPVGKSWDFDTAFKDVTENVLEYIDNPVSSRQQERRDKKQSNDIDDSNREFNQIISEYARICKKEKKAEKLADNIHSLKGKIESQAQSITRLEGTVSTTTDNLKAVLPALYKDTKPVQEAINKQDLQEVTVILDKEKSYKSKDKQAISEMVSISKKRVNDIQSHNSILSQEKKQLSLLQDNYNKLKKQKAVTLTLEEKEFKATAELKISDNIAKLNEKQKAELKNTDFSLDKKRQGKTISVE